MSYEQDEVPTAPIRGTILMSMPQAREALAAIPPDYQSLAWAIARAFWDDGFAVGIIRGPRIPPSDRSPDGVNTLAPLGRKKRR